MVLTMISQSEILNCPKLKETKNPNKLWTIKLRPTSPMPTKLMKPLLPLTLKLPANTITWSKLLPRLVNWLEHSKPLLSSKPQPTRSSLRLPHTLNPLLLILSPTLLKNSTTFLCKWPRKLQSKLTNHSLRKSSISSMIYSKLKTMPLLLKLPLNKIDKTNIILKFKILPKLSKTPTPKSSDSKTLSKVSKIRSLNFRTTSPHGTNNYHHCKLHLKIMIISTTRESTLWIKTFLTCPVKLKSSNKLLPSSKELLSKMLNQLLKTLNTVQMKLQLFEPWHTCSNE